MILQVLTDFSNDFHKICKERLLLNNMSSRISNDESVIDTSIKYIEYKNRIITPSKRKVHISKEFEIPPNLEKPVLDIIFRLKTGMNLYIYQSRDIMNPNKKDGMLLDWDIQHLHLETEKDWHGFIKRTGNILYLRVTATDAYLIKIAPHGEWYEKELIEILHSNWRESLSSFQLKELISAGETPKNLIKSSRNKHNYLLYTMDDGTVYLPFGHGVTSTGISNFSLMIYDLLIDEIYDLEKWVHNEGTRFLKLSEDHLGSIKFYLLMTDFMFKVITENSNIVFIKELFDEKIYIREYPDFKSIVLDDMQNTKLSDQPGFRLTGK